MSISNEKALESHSNIISSTINDEKVKTKEEVQWTLEEEFLFFEAHTVFGNKWTRYISILKDKATKDLKNHFHACIIKSVRRIINNKFDCKLLFLMSHVADLKDIMRCFYACTYLKQLTDKMQNWNSSQVKKLNKKRYKYNPKVLIKNKKLSLEKIDNYSMRLMKEVLFKKDIIKELVFKLHLEDQFGLHNINLLFSILIKAKLFLNCLQIKKDNLLINAKNELVLSQFINDNYNSICYIAQASKC